jgi:hypothetical protein
LIAGIWVDGQEYDESLHRVVPLKERLAKADALIDKERLAKADALIDAVVYRLYGLTEEEIRVVEGKG